MKEIKEIKLTVFTDQHGALDVLGLPNGKYLLAINIRNKILTQNRAMNMEASSVTNH